MTMADIYEKMAALSNPALDDPEKQHADGDELLCEALRALGHEELVKLWDAISPKWYA